jgi:LysR family transcriptional regulator, chromosome initiation inhibitor
MHIDNAQLTAFAAVLTEGTFELAARKLSVTPSAISQRIKLLEDRMGQILIHRSTPCQATVAGRTLLRHAEQIALLESEVFSALGVSDETEARIVRLPIVVNIDSLDSWFAQIFGHIPDNGSLVLDIRAEDQDHSETLLREGTVMAGVSTSAHAIQGCRAERLGAMRYLAVAAPAFCNTHFADGVSPVTLGAAPMLRFNKKDALQAEFIAHITAATLKPPTHFVPSTKAFIEAIHCGVGWGMLPEQFVADSLTQGKLRELAPDHVLDIPLYWHRWRIDSHALDTLTHLVRQAAAGTLR